VSVVRAGKRRRGGGGRGHDYEVVTPPLPGQRAEVSLHVLEPGSATGGPDDPPMHEPGARETAVVTDGRLRLVCDGTGYDLEQGDAVTFDADLPHRFENPDGSEARFFAATTDPVSEHAPYFDPREGEEKARAALALGGKWVSGSLITLPLPEEQEALKNELYDLHLILAQTLSQREADAPAAHETLALLQEAEPLAPPSRGYYRLSAWANGLLGQEKQAAEDRQHADDPRTPVASLDHFLLGEQYRTASAHSSKGEAKRKEWQADPSGLEKAAEEYRQGLRIDPDHYWLHFQLGRCYLSLGRFGEAVEALGACVALRPEAPWAYSVRGLALAQQNHFAEAQSILAREAAVLLEPRVSVVIQHFAPGVGVVAR